MTQSRDYNVEITVYMKARNLNLFEGLVTPDIFIRFRFIILKNNFFDLEHLTEIFYTISTFFEMMFS